MGWPTVEAIVGNKIAPGWLDAYLARTCYDAQMTDEPEDPDRPDNLWEPVTPGDHGAHGTLRPPVPAHRAGSSGPISIATGWPPRAQASRAWRSSSGQNRKLTGVKLSGRTFIEWPEADRCPPAAGSAAARCPPAGPHRGAGAARPRGPGSPARGTARTAPGCTRPPS